MRGQVSFGVSNPGDALGEVVDVDADQDRFDDRLPLDQCGDDFVRWPVLVEVESPNRADRIGVVSSASRLLEILWGNEYAAVASCDFEDELPTPEGIG